MTFVKTRRDRERQKLWPRERPKAYRLWSGDADYSSKWWRFGRDRSTATTLSTWVVRTEETDEQLLAVKGAIHNVVSSSCISGKKGTGAEHGCEPCPAPRNQSSRCEGLGLGSLLTSSLILEASRASMAISSGSGALVVTTPEGGSPATPSSSKDPSPDVAIDILSSDGTPNEMLGVLWNEPAKSPGNRTGHSLCEE